MIVSEFILDVENKLLRLVNNDDSEDNFDEFLSDNNFINNLYLYIVYCRSGKRTPRNAILKEWIENFNLDELENIHDDKGISIDQSRKLFCDLLIKHCQDNDNLQKLLKIFSNYKSFIDDNQKNFAFYQQKVKGMPLMPKAGMIALFFYKWFGINIKTKKGRIVLWLLPIFIIISVLALVSVTVFTYPMATTFLSAVTIFSMSGSIVWFVFMIILAVVQKFFDRSFNDSLNKIFTKSKTLDAIKNKKGAIMKVQKDTMGVLRLLQLLQDTTNQNLFNQQIDSIKEFLDTSMKHKLMFYIKKKFSNEKAVELRCYLMLLVARIEEIQNYMEHIKDCNISNMSKDQRRIIIHLLEKQLISLFKDMYFMWDFTNNNVQFPQVPNDLKEKKENLEICMQNILFILNTSHDSDAFNKFSRQQERKNDNNNLDKIPASNVLAPTIKQEGRVPEDTQPGIEVFS